MTALEVRRYLHSREENKSRPNIFPNKIVAGQFNPHSHTVEISTIDVKHFHHLKDRYDFLSLRPHLETIFHELTHWADQLGTVWGQRYMVLLYEAMHVIEDKSPEAENQYWKVMDLHDEERRINFAKYYKIIQNAARSHDQKKPWRIDYSAGQEFDCSGRLNSQRPIFFVKFSDNVTGQPIVRQPIGIGALLETIATWTELLIGIMVTSSLPEADGTQLVEQHLIRGERIGAAYDEDLTDYSAAIHMLSVKVGTKDIFFSYALGALVASVALNLPEELFDNLNHPESFKPFGDDLLASFKTSRNRGYVFTTIVWHAPKFDPKVDRFVWLDKALNAAGLPTKKEIDIKARVEMKKIASIKIPGERGMAFSYLLSCGREIFESRCDEPGVVFQTLEDKRFVTPPIFDSNGDLLILNENFPDPQFWHPYVAYETANEFDKEFENFRSACR